MCYLRERFDIVTGIILICSQELDKTINSVVDDLFRRFLAINNPLIRDCCKENVNVNYFEIFAKAHTFQLVHIIRRWSVTHCMEQLSYYLRQSNLSE